jgi:pimeloyl-ACP methyl ester carboxylesterase
MSPLGRRRRRAPHVLLVHAGGFDGRMWRPLAERLDDRFRLHMPDLRGHGSTPLPPEPFAHAEDLVRLLDDLRIDRAVVVGCSYGGWVSLQLAKMAPQRVRALALMPGTLMDTDDWSPEIEAYWAEEERLVEAGDIDGAVALNVRTWVREPQVADLVAEMVRTAIERQAGIEAEERELPVDLGAIAVPTLIVSGGRDFPDFARMADRVAAEVPGAERAEVEDAGHLIALERPDAAAELLVPFLERVGP